MGYDKETARIKAAKYRALNPEKCKATQAKYYASNPEKVKAKRKKYRAENKERIKIRERKYYVEHKEEIKAKGIAYYIKNGEALRVKGRVRYANNKEKMRASGRKSYIKNESTIWARGLKRRFGINMNEYNKIYFEQQGRCAICGIPGQDLERRLHVDHDHETGKIRGLLCSKCNRALGLFRDSSVITENATNYLNYHTVSSISAHASDEPGNRSISAKER